MCHKLDHLLQYVWRWPEERGWLLVFKLTLIIQPWHTQPEIHQLPQRWCWNMSSYIRKGGQCYASATIKTPTVFLHKSSTFFLFRNDWVFVPVGTVVVLKHSLCSEENFPAVTLPTFQLKASLVFLSSALGWRWCVCVGCYWWSWYIYVTPGLGRCAGKAPSAMTWATREEHW